MRRASPVPHPSRLAPAVDLRQRLDRLDPDRAATIRVAPAGTRADLAALIAFNYELARVREVVSQPVLGQIRLQWWRDTLAEIYTGKPVRRHDVALPLARAIRRRGLSRRHLYGLIEAREQDLRETPPADMAELEAYAYGTGARLSLARLEALCIADRAAERAVAAVGTAWALIGICRAVPFHASRRRIHIPAELLVAAGLDADRVFAGEGKGRLSEAVRIVADRAAALLAEARALRRHVPRRALPALIEARFADRYLAILVGAGYDPYDRRVAQPLRRRTRALDSLRGLISGRY